MRRSYVEVPYVKTAMTLT